MLTNCCNIIFKVAVSSSDTSTYDKLENEKEEPKKTFKDIIDGPPVVQCDASTGEMDIISKDAEITRLQKFESVANSEKTTIDIKSIEHEIKAIEKDTENVTDEPPSTESSQNTKEKLDTISPTPVAPPRRKRKQKKDLKQVCCIPMIHV